MKREVLGKAYLKTQYLNRDPPEVKVQAIRTPGRSLFQAERPWGGTGLEEGCFTVGWHWEQVELSGPHFMQDLCRPSSSFGFCSSCVGMSFVYFEQTRFFKASNQLSLHLLCRELSAEDKSGIKKAGSEVI